MNWLVRNKTWDTSYSTFAASVECAVKEYVESIRWEDFFDDSGNFEEEGVIVTVQREGSCLKQKFSIKPELVAKELEEEIPEELKEARERIAALEQQVKELKKLAEF